MKSHMKNKPEKNSQGNTEREEPYKEWGRQKSPPESQIYQKAVISTKVLHWLVNRHISQRNRLGSTSTYGNVMYDKVGISRHWDQNYVGTTRHLLRKKEIEVYP